MSKDVSVIISVAVMRNDIAIVIIKHDGRKLGLPNAPVLVVMEKENNRKE